MTPREWLARLDAAVIDAPARSPVRLAAGTVGVILAAVALVGAIVIGWVSLVWTSVPGLIIAAGLLLLAAVIGVLALSSVRHRP